MSDQLHFEDVTNEPEDDDGAAPGPVMNVDIGDADYKVGEFVEVPNTNGQLFKKVITEGTGTARPSPGSSVVCHYVGTLESDGSQFDSSRDRDQPFDFNLGEGSVIKAWDIGLQTFKKNERSVLRGLGPFCYGERGSPPKIPPNATLLFDIELLSWEKKPQDVSQQRDMSVMKDELEAGSGTARPDYESNVVIDVALEKKEADADGSTTVVASKDGWAFEIGDVDNMPPGFESAIKSMKKGEKSKFTFRGSNGGAAAFAQLVKLISNGSSDSSSSDTNVSIFTATITMRSLDVVKTWGWKNDEIIERATERKEQGNAAFKAGRLQKAILKYGRGLSFVEHDYGLETESCKAQARELRFAFLGNSAQIMLATRNFAKCIEFCDKILVDEPRHGKSIFRKAKALLATEEFEEAMALLKGAFDAAARGTDDEKRAADDLQNLLAEVAQKKKEYTQKQQQQYSKMFA